MGQDLEGYWQANCDAPSHQLGQVLSAAMLVAGLTPPASGGWSFPAPDLPRRPCGTRCPHRRPGSAAGRLEAVASRRTGG